MSDYADLLKPFKLKHLPLRNRVMSTAHAPHFAEDGMPGERYQLYHAEKAKGGIGLTIFGGSSSVAVDSPLSFSQIDISHDRVLPYLQNFAKRVHEQGAALFCQITHLGRRGRWDTRYWLPLIGASKNREPLHRAFAKEMEDFDFPRVIRAYGAAARRCRESGLDGCEVIAVAHHLIDSFLSPAVNQRTDQYGGSLENRARFGLEVLQEVRPAQRLSGGQCLDRSARERAQRRGGRAQGGSDRVQAGHAAERRALFRPEAACAQSGRDRPRRAGRGQAPTDRDQPGRILSALSRGRCRPEPECACGDL